MVIPHRQLTAEALRGVIEEFVSREGTDYGGVTVCLAHKVQEVRDQLDRGDAVVVFDDDTNSCNIVARPNVPRQLPPHLPR
ncbi:MAG: YheU family protein [Deltaproteobacteria bacterium]|nr:YheU family protein [Deltaproteobacteria bacterium]